jgi:hypothetical protein
MEDLNRLHTMGNKNEAGLAIRSVLVAMALLGLLRQCDNKELNHEPISKQTTTQQKE